MKSFFIRLVLIIITGFLLIWSYFDLVSRTEINRVKKAELYLSQNVAIEELQSKYPEHITMREVKEYDTKHGTQMSLSLNNLNSIKWIHHNKKSPQISPVNEQTSQPINNLRNYSYVESKDPLVKANVSTYEDIPKSNFDILKDQNSSTAEEIENEYYGFWSNVPFISALLITALGIFFARLINNSADSVYRWVGKKNIKIGNVNVD